MLTYLTKRGKIAQYVELKRYEKLVNILLFVIMKVSVTG